MFIKFCTRITDIFHILTDLSHPVIIVIYLKINHSQLIPDADLLKVIVIVDMNLNQNFDKKL